MSNDLETIVEASPVEAPSDHTDHSKRLRWLELSLVLLVCFGNSIFGSLDILINGRSALANTPQFRWVVSFVHEATGLLLLGYILARRKIRFADLGFRWSFRDLGMGLTVAAASYVAYVAGIDVVRAVDRAMNFPAHSVLVAREIFGRPSIATIPYFFLNPFYEELVVRAYLMTEVRALTGSWIFAAALSVIVQTSYHLYYGWEGAIALSFQFLAFSIYYAWTRKATPIIVAHGVFDIYGLIRMW